MLMVHKSAAGKIPRTGKAAKSGPVTTSDGRGTPAYREALTRAGGDESRLRVESLDTVWVVNGSDHLIPGRRRGPLPTPPRRGRPPADPPVKRKRSSRAQS